MHDNTYRGAGAIALDTRRPHLRNIEIVIYCVLEPPSYEILLSKRVIFAHLLNSVNYLSLIIRIDFRTLDI